MSYPFFVCCNSFDRVNGVTLHHSSDSMSSLGCLLPLDDIFMEGIYLNVGRFGNASVFEKWIDKLVNN